MSVETNQTKPSDWGLPEAMQVIHAARRFGRSPKSAVRLLEDGRALLEENERLARELADWREGRKL